MDLETIVGYAISAIGGGGIVKLITLRSTKKKAAVEVKMDEIQLIHNTIEQVYQPIINQQNKTIEQQNNRIQELDTEVRELRTQLSNERKEHQKDIDVLNRRILAITKALGLKADDRIRDENGRYKKNNE